MATIHATTMSPGKLELLATWLPQQPWYDGPAAPELARAGGFRLDDPAGEVGLELMVVAVAGGGAYLVPLTYRGSTVPALEPALIGTSQHGVLGLRWIYDGARDPVLQEQLVAALLGTAVPQHQSRSDEVDETVVVRPAPSREAAETAQVVRALTQSAPDGPGISIPWVTAEGTTVTGVAVGATAGLQE